jgi:hypothetical protein
VRPVEEVTRALLTLLLTLALAPAALAQGPQTGFEQSDGATFTTHEQEVAFLAAVDAGSPRATVSVIGTTKTGKPLHLVELGSAGSAAARSRPTAMMTCSQHGNEPAGREACLRMLRDLAFTTDPALVSLLETTTLLFIPAANPDGREANTRGNSEGTDINRDHLGLDTPEARAMAKVVLDYQPELALDLHEYGPSMPVIYDDSMLWLWPRNLNTDAAVHDLALEFGRKYIEPAADEAGYTTDEYGQYEVADNDVQQTAGDADEGIMRNAMGLRHVLGILVETRVDADARQDPGEVADEAAVQRRRVQSHYVVLQSMLKFMRERGAEAARVTQEAIRRKAEEGARQSAPLYFGGADNQAPTAEQTVNPPPCGYALTAQQVTDLGPRLELHGIQSFISPKGPFVSLAQPAEPLIPLLLDERGLRTKSKGTPVMGDCPGAPTPALPPATGPAPPVVAPLAPSGAACTKRRTVTIRLPRRKGKLLSAKVTALGKRAKVRRGVAAVRLQTARPGARVKVRIVQRVRRGKRVKTYRTTRTLKVCAS